MILPSVPAILPERESVGILTRVRDSTEESAQSLSILSVVSTHPHGSLAFRVRAEYWNAAEMELMARDRKAARLLMVSATAAVVVAVSATAHAVGPRRSKTDKADSASKLSERSERPIVRLNFVSTPWEEVLEHVANQTRSTLVLHEVPNGRFSRRDFRGHTRTEAIRILNQELEPLGFRILEKDAFLTVIEIQQAGLEYPRHTVRSEAVPQDISSADDVGTAQIGSVSRSNQSKATTIHQAGYEAEPDTAGTQQADTPTGTVESSESEKSIERQTVATDRPVTEVAKQLYAAFGDQTELIPTEAGQLPAFRVYRQSPPDTKPEARELWFILEMDTAINELHVHAPARVAAGVAELIRRFDKTPPKDGETVRVVPEAEQADAVAQQLNAQLRELRRQRRTQTSNDPFAAAQPDRAAGSEESDAETEPAEVESSPASPGTLRVLGNLRGDVSVDALADLDLLLLRGNERDVESVMQVIELIERMAVGASPGIQLLFLRNVDSEALAELLNDVYTRLTTISAGSAASARQTRAVNVVAVGSPNAILILAPQNAIDSVVELAEQLDAPQPPGNEVEVFFLRNAIASQVVTLLEGFYEDRPGLGTSIRVVADGRTNSVVVNASPKELAEVSRLVRKIDSERSHARAQVRVVPLKNALADDLAEFLNSVIQGVVNPAQTGAGQQFAAAGGTGADQALRDAKSMVLEFLTTDGVARRIVRSGVLSDIRITGDIRSNTLTITAPETSMGLLLELVAVLDQPTSAVAEIKAYTLERADAEIAAEMLRSLFPEAEEGQPGVQLAGAEGGSSALVPFRVTVDSRSNTVVYVGSPDVLQMAEAVLFRIDQEASRNRRVETLRLRNSPAADVATALNQYLQSQRELLQIDPDRVSTADILEQEVIVTPEPISNNLIISATPQVFEQILNLAKQLDREPPQVMISSLIVEVTLDDTDEFGVELGFQDSVLFDRSVIDPDSLVTISETTTLPTGTQTTTQRIISQTGVPGFLFNNQALGNNAGGGSGRVGTQGLSNFALGRVNDSLGFGGLVLSASSEAVSVLLRALAAHRHVQILSNPSVTALDNQEAQIQQGQLVPVVNGVNINQTTGSANPLVIQDEAGIILTVTPRISEDGQIVMQVIAEKSQYDLQNGVPLFTDASTGNIITSPIKDVTTAVTTAKVQDGQTIVIGGLITESEDVLTAGVPYLKDIPILGNAFRFDSRRSRRTELLIFLTPRVVHNDADVELIKQVEMERMHFFEDEAERIHGPLMGVPAASLVPIGGPGMVYPTPAAEPARIILEPQLDSGIEQPPPQLPPADSGAPVEPKKSLLRKPEFLKR